MSSSSPLRSTPEGPGSVSGAPNQPATQGDPGDARIIEEHHITGPHGEDEIEGTDDRGRRWYHPRPDPRRRTDFMGVNSTWWMAVGWVIVLLVIFFPFPWWW